MASLIPSTRSNEIRSLTGLRGVAACLVVLYHLGGHHLGQGSVRQFIEHGYLWVDLFFSLSGFVLALTYGQKFAENTTVETVRTYTLDRIARIFPLFWFVTLYVFGNEHIGVYVKGHSHSGWFTLLSNLLLVQTWGIGGSIVGPGWSLSTEWAASLAFPLLAVLVMAHRRRGLWLAFLLSILSLAWLALIPSRITGAHGINGPMDLTTGTSYAPVLRCFADFTLGIITFRISTNTRIRHIAAHNVTSLGIASAIVALCCLREADLAVIALFPMFIASVSFGDPFVARLLGLAPLHHIGKISYSLYLIHVLAIFPNTVLEKTLTSYRVPGAVDVSLILSIAITIGVATLTYCWIEVPGRNAFRRLFARWRTGRSFL